MLRTLPLMLLAILLLLGACGDDDDGPSATPSDSDQPASETASSDDGSDETETPADEKTPGPDGSPTDQTPGPTAPGDVPTAPPTSSEGTPAVQPADESAFLAQFDGQDVQIETCAYNPATALTNCPGFGLYAIDPPIVGQDTQCDLWVVAETPRAIQCRSADPVQTRNYEIQA